MTLNLPKNLDVTNVLKILRDFDICSSILGPSMFSYPKSLSLFDKYITYARGIFKNIAGSKFVPNLALDLSGKIWIDAR